VTELKQSSLLEKYQRLIEISGDLASTLDLNTLLNRIVHVAADLCHAEAASILLYDETNQQLYFQAASNLDEPMMRGLLVPVDASIAGWILTQRQPVIIPDTRKDPRHFGSIAKPTGVETTSLLGVPLITKDKVIGVLEAINKLAGHFSDEDLEVLAALGAQAAVAIENARLFQQSDLIAEMVHELRTPLSSLNTAAHLLLRPEINDEQRKKMVQTMFRETSRLSDMATAFLDLARLESGRVQFQISDVEPKQLLEECMVVMRSKAEEKNQTVLQEIPKDLPTIRADRDKMKQVILNLLSNAIKYTPSHGQIMVSAKANQEDLIIRISDNGPGIPPDNLPHIFEKFYRVPGTEHAAQGTGLGLSICKRIIEAHRGRIELKSELGVGTTFSIFMPLKVI
jgi:signal transduction histidine kinase